MNDIMNAFWGLVIIFLLCSPFLFLGMIVWANWSVKRSGKPQYITDEMRERLYQDEPLYIIDDED